MSEDSSKQQAIKLAHPQGEHPIRVRRGELYYANLTRGVGTELYGSHMVIVVKNDANSLYSPKVLVVPIEGNGRKITSGIHMRIYSNDIVGWNLKRNPSRIIACDVMTIDKSRLGNKLGYIEPKKFKKLIGLVLKQFS